MTIIIILSFMKFYSLVAIKVRNNLLILKQFKANKSYTTAAILTKSKLYQCVMMTHDDTR